MESSIVVAIIAASVATLSAIIAGVQAKLSRDAARADRYAEDNALLYLWNRELVDHIYKGKPPPAPVPPAGLFKGAS